ncbi:histidine kinase [Phycicoccus endophyticus]|uniref:Histidine kinase n=1 Tax=Phycicoccus endophyticus TaxID=1690220 RepID=A0A7G9R3N5_9MICO|nr:histidine kinase [Phycicoccus endophyticus]NHI18029.1 histidine kinase [Phycicoccus endophyticus]QNN50210.1 histidine kinase [Phycicoccus endophyticus]GGL26986.1 hypothetical protein GCM10012283_06530 [Phycicoccus endophyticus]
MTGWPWVSRREAEDLLPPAPRDLVAVYRALGLLWLAYLAQPVLAGWRARDTVPGALGLAAVLAFAAVYAWHFVRSRPLHLAGLEGPAPAPLPWAARARYGLLAGLVALATLTLGQDATATWVFLAIAGLWTFRRWVPYVLAVGLIVLYEVLAHRAPSWERDDSLSIALALAVVAVSGVMLALRRSRDLEEARRENARLAVEEERNRMARDLHDVLGHSLTVIRVKSELAARLVDLDPARARAEVEAVETLAREALGDVRAAVEGFRDISLAAELARARAALGSAGIEAELPWRVEGIDPVLDELYAWTVREGVTNVIRHSGARRCTVTIDERGLRLSDDGAVASAAGRAAGHGLRGLAERARTAGATVRARRLEPSGFELVVSTPAAGGGA